MAKTQAELDRENGERYAWFFRWCVSHHRSVVNEFVDHMKEGMKAVEELAEEWDAHEREWKENEG